MGKANQPKKKQSNSQLWIVAGIAVLAVAGLIALGVYTQPKKEEPATVLNAPTDSELKANRNVQGNPNAEVEVVEWGDYL